LAAFSWVQSLYAINGVSIFVRLFLAVLLGGIIGFERGIKGRPAGMRTYMLVCLGSALVMITNEYMSYVFVGADPARMGAQVISGIGFLGAGTIIITRGQQVRGLTTAAGLWASACMGLAIGVGFYAGALIGMFFILFVTGIVHRLDTTLVSRSRLIDIYVELRESGHIYPFLEHLRTLEIQVRDVEVQRPKYDKENQSALTLTLLLPKQKRHYEVLVDLNAIDYVGFAEEV